MAPRSCLRYGAACAPRVRRTCNRRRPKVIAVGLRGERASAHGLRAHDVALRRAVLLRLRCIYARCGGGEEPEACAARAGRLHPNHATPNDRWTTDASCGGASARGLEQAAPDFERGHVRGAVRLGRVLGRADHRPRRLAGRRSHAHRPALGSGHERFLDRRIQSRHRSVSARGVGELPRQRAGLRVLRFVHRRRRTPPLRDAQRTRSHHTEPLSSLDHLSVGHARSHRRQRAQPLCLRAQLARADGRQRRGSPRTLRQRLRTAPLPPR